MNTKQLQITEHNARKLYATASAEFKATLEDTFGKEFFIMKVTDRIKTKDDAYSETARPIINDWSIFPEDLRDFFARTYDLVVVTEALNEGTKMDYDDKNQKKYRSWWEKSPSGFVFDGSSYIYSGAVAGSGRRFALKSDELVQHAATNFPSIYNDFLTK